MRYISAMHRFLIPVCLLALLWGCASPEQKRESHYQKGLNYMENDKPREAIIEFRNAVQADPQFAEGYYRIGLAYLELEAPVFAFKNLERAAKLDPSNLDALLKPAEMLFLGKQIEESRERLERILTLNPEFPGALLLAANLELADKNTDKAAVFLQQAEAADPDFDRTYRVWAKLHLASGDFAEVERALQKAVEMGPHNMANHNALVSFYLSRRDPAAAEKVLLNMVSAFPKEVEPRLGLAKLYRKQNQRDKAEQTLNGAVRMRPDDPDLLVVMADFYRKDNRMEEAESAYRQAMDKAKKPLKYKAVLADFFLHQGDDRTARELVADILAVDKNHKEGLLVQAKIFSREKNFDEALKLFETLLIKDSTWSAVYYRKALVLKEMGQDSLAERAAEKAVQYSPEHSEARTLLARILLERGSVREAGLQAGQALELEPKNFRAGIIYGIALLQAKKAAEALQLLETMEGWFSENVEILWHKGRALMLLEKQSEARTVFQRILEIQPGHLAATKALLEIFSNQGQKSQAMAMLRQQRKKSPENPDILMLLGVSLFQKKEYGEALEIFRKMQSVVPERPNPYIMEAMTLKKLGREPLGVDSFRKAMEGESNNPSVLMGLAALLELNEELEAAKEIYEQILQIDPESAQAANNLAWLILHEEEGDLDEALKYAVQARKVLPGNPYISDTLGLVHLKRGFPYLAEAQFLRSVETLPQEPLYRYHLAQALNAQGEKERARQALKECFELEKEFEGRNEAKRLYKELGGR